MRSQVDKPQPSRAQWLRKLAQRRRDRVAFVFSGGGPLGALQVGAIRALFEQGITPDLTVGTSVGAMNATFTSFNPTSEGAESLVRIWSSLNDTDLFPGGRFKASWARFLVRGNKVFDNVGLKKMIETRLGDVHFEDAQIPLGIVATDLDSGDEKIFTSGRILPPLLASAAMPGVYPPVEIDGHVYVDGGVANNVPIAPAITLGARTVYVMDSTSHTHQKRPLNRPIDYLLHAFTLARAQRLQIEQKMFSEKVKVVMLPTPKLDFFVPFASMEFTDKLITMGYETVRGFLAGTTPTPVEAEVQPGVEVIAPAK
ncbi:MAG: patatin-like phospholipase family protein [Actinomycetota bacterium]|nr:patatin-like phospholipase family protein [Actinomycetota bacterium]